MKQSPALYGTLMHGASPLTRAQREMLAVTVSARTTLPSATALRPCGRN